MYTKNSLALCSSLTIQAYKMVYKTSGGHRNNMKINVPTDIIKYNSHVKEIARKSKKKK